MSRNTINVIIAARGVLSRVPGIGREMLMLLATAGVLFAVSPFDLEISRRLMNPTSQFGHLIQDWGTKPATLLILMAGTLLAHAPWRRKYAVAARAAVALVAQFVVQPMVLTNLIKLVAGRTRPIYLDEAGAAFRPFWDFRPGFGDFSFPSGHVAIAMILAPVVLVLWKSGRRGPALGVAAFTAAWAGAVAYGRVIFGAHFATDVLFSIGIGLALAPLTAHLGMAALQAVRSGSAAPSARRSNDCPEPGSER